MTTQMKNLTPNLMVEDVNQTVDFYKNQLGFDLIATVPETGHFNWAMMKQGGVEMQFQQRASLTEEITVLKDKPIGGALTLYIGVEGIEELHERLKSNVTIVQAMHSTFYGTQEFAIQDINGFIISFAETIANG
jgi:uncharacterized glyoxalase superfamily protein PhnB